MKNFKIILILMITIFISLFASASVTQDINLIISVDWEGYSLEDYNLEAMRKFRDDYPNIKIVHFLNAAYFLKKGIKLSTITKKIKSVIRKGDELGLHIHPFETLLKASGVSYKEGQTFWGRSESVPINGVRGHDLPLSLFNEAELRLLIRTSIHILEKNGFKNLRSFRAGGWSASPEVLSALVKEGIFIDSSAVSPAIIRNLVGRDSPLYKDIVNKYWANTTIQSANTYEIETSAGKILEIPNNFALADYITGISVFKNFKIFINAIDFSSEHPVNLHYGFHQETAAQFIGEVRSAIDNIAKYISAYQIELYSKTFQDLVVKKRKRRVCSALF
jgi:hypothetical protein